MIPNNPERLLALGKVLKPHGITGCLRILSFASDPLVFEEIGLVYIGRKDGPMTREEVIWARPFKGIVLMKLKGIQDRSQAEAFKGLEVFVEKERLPRKDGEYFWFELMGLKVLDQQGHHVGDVKDMLRTSGHDTLVIAWQNREWYLPMVDEFIKEISIEKGYIRVFLLEGLLSLDEV